MIFLNIFFHLKIIRRTSRFRLVLRQYTPSVTRPINYLRMVLELSSALQTANVGGSMHSVFKKGSPS